LWTSLALLTDFNSFHLQLHRVDPFSSGTPSLPGCSTLVHGIRNGPRVTHTFERDDHIDVWRVLNSTTDIPARLRDEAEAAR
jgi:hypothetical protein